MEEIDLYLDDTRDGNHEGSILLALHHADRPDVLLRVPGCDNLSELCSVDDDNDSGSNSTDP